MPVAVTLNNITPAALSRFHSSAAHINDPHWCWTRKVFFICSSYREQTQVRAFLVSQFIATDWRSNVLQWEEKWSMWNVLVFIIYYLIFNKVTNTNKHLSCSWWSTTLTGSLVCRILWSTWEFILPLHGSKAAPNPPQYPTVGTTVPSTLYSSIFHSEFGENQIK